MARLALERLRTTSSVTGMDAFTAGDRETRILNRSGRRPGHGMDAFIAWMATPGLDRDTTIFSSC
jgi:hypothetical protein